MRYFRPLLLVGLGLIALSLTLAMDYHFGKLLAIDGDAQMILGLAFLSIDLMVVGLAFVNGGLFRDGQKALATCLATFIVFGSLLAMTATIGYGGTQRLGKIEAAQAANANAKAAAQAQNAANAEQRQRVEEWLKGTVWRKGNRNDRRDAIQSVTALANKPVDIVEVPVAAPPSDLQAEVLARTMTTLHVPVDIESVQIGLTLALALFLTLGEALCFGLAAYLWPQPDPARAARSTPKTRRKPHEESKETLSPAPAVQGPSFRRVRKLTRVATANGADSAIPVADEDDTDLDLTQDISDLADAIGPDVAEFQESREHVAHFLAERTQFSFKARVQATTLYRAYVAWEQRQRREPLNQNMFGRVCTTLHVLRDPATGGRVWYTGLKLLPELDAGPEVALARAA